MLRNEILKYLHVLNEKLQLRNVKGEICLYGGAVSNHQTGDSIFFRGSIR